MVTLGNWFLDQPRIFVPDLLKFAKIANLAARVGAGNELTYE